MSAADVFAYVIGGLGALLVTLIMVVIIYISTLERIPNEDEEGLDP